MTLYDAAPAWFRTPGGRSVLVYVREGTNDWNTANASLTEDEYQTRDLRITGTFLDIGGYLGTVALGILVDNPTAYAIIVEPLPENRALIVRNLEANGLGSRATLLAGVVGTGEVTVTYAYSDSENDLHHAFVGNGFGGNHEGEHRSVTYTAFRYRDITHEDVGFVKIDCEGGEWGILHELTAVPLIVGEIHPVPLPDGEAGSRARLERILGATHDITYGGPEGSPAAWGFRAVRR